MSKHSSDHSNNCHMYPFDVFRKQLCFSGYLMLSTGIWKIAPRHCSCFQYQKSGPSYIAFLLCFKKGVASFIAFPHFPFHKSGVSYSIISKGEELPS